jgi:hypothetical protein
MQNGKLRYLGRSNLRSGQQCTECPECSGRSTNLATL